MSKYAQELKAQLHRMTKECGIPVNTLLQHFIMERFLERLSLSEYVSNFIVKGGCLIASMVGLARRSTVDIDTTVRGLPIREQTIEAIVHNIIETKLNDNVIFTIERIINIHDKGKYEDFRISLMAAYDTLRVPLKIDITTGDVIIPQEISYSYKLLFNDRKILIRAYSIETILAEKIESILARNVANTRARDFYDVHLFYSLRGDEIQYPTLKKSLMGKARERDSVLYVDNWRENSENIKGSADLQTIWNSYSKKYQYAANISFEEVIHSLQNILDACDKYD